MIEFSDALAKKMKDEQIQEAVFEHIREVSFFETVVSYLIDWRNSWIKTNLRSWINDNLELPEELKKKVDKYRPLVDKDKVKIVLDFVNSELTYVPDKTVWKTEEKWQTPTETWTMKTGDCEDGALLIYAILHYLDVPDYQVYIVAGDVVGGGHCYVTYMADSGLEYPLDWCYWFSESVRLKIPYTSREEYYYGQNEWFRFNSSGSYKLRN
jgi:hypothetical protein